MNTKIDYKYPLYRELPPSVRILYSMILIVMGIGYIFALIQIWVTHAGYDGKPGLSVEDIKIAYAGNPATSRLETALKGPMNGMVSADKRAEIIAWARTGGDPKKFETTVKPIMESTCYLCHNGSNPHIPNLTKFSVLKKLIARDTGPSIDTLVRISHIHLFGLTFIFSIMGFIFAHAQMKNKPLKCIVMAIPFLAIIMDIASWYLTKVSTTFAYTVIIGGALMGMAFAFQWLVSFYQIWFGKHKEIKETS